MVQTKCGFDSSVGADGSALLTSMGPTLYVDIGFDPAYLPTQQFAPAPGLQKVEALVDTGASISCIDNILASQLNLPIINRTPISGVHGSADANTYLAQIHIPALKITIYGEFVGVELQAGGQMHKALIGRTFLKHFTMTYEGRTGTVILSND